MKIPILFLFLALPAFAAEALHPLDTPASWEFGDKSAWTWSKEGTSPVLSLTKQSDFKPKVRSPFNLAWLTTKDFKSFTLTVDARLTKFDKTNNDLCIAFAKQDESRFYYAHLGVRADDVHDQIHLVDHADRRAVTATRGTGIPWKPGTWHKLKLTHDTATGNITVFFDDMVKPVLTATDKTLDHGLIGLGSFDDTGEFKNLEINDGVK